MTPAASLCIALAVVGALGAPAHAQLVNGSFEASPPASFYQLLPAGSTAIPGWVTRDNGVEWFAPALYGYGNAPDGTMVVDLACYTYSAGGLRQTFATVPGHTYVVTYQLGTHQVSGRDGTAEVVVSADGQSATHVIANHSSLIAWEPRTFTFIADDASATLSFRCLQNANLHFAYIDAAGVTAATPARLESWGTIKQRYR